eukprot:CAMPEP_0201955556 /NCGR_PEP_ID=MMETSP0904-20121228/3061_1 /ASSEMBLY_ACC=CAM_ASM_000553 /TAXON_ID=420261 /ORGANISM="Thalassiosira antarctica, Strain CCMP982" /LENGTH=81 /DNA_ID=CAMNT_0048499703 /DNA_START=615 /DNA_END=857 /DNA_ORIENTATION=+
MICLLFIIGGINLDNGPFVEYDMCVKFVIGEDQTPDTCKFTIVGFNGENVKWNLEDESFPGDLYANSNGIFRRDVIELIDL